MTIPYLRLPTIVLGDSPSCSIILCAPTRRPDNVPTTVADMARLALQETALDESLTAREAAGVRLLDVRAAKIRPDDARLRLDGSEKTGPLNQYNWLVHTLCCSGAVELSATDLIQNVLGQVSPHDQGGENNVEALALVLVLPDGLKIQSPGHRIIRSGGNDMADVPPPYVSDFPSRPITGIADPLIPSIRVEVSSSNPLPYSKHSSTERTPSPTLTGNSYVSSVLTALNPSLSHRFEALQQILDELERPVGKAALGGGTALPGVSTDSSDQSNWAERFPEWEEDAAQEPKEDEYNFLPGADEGDGDKPRFSSPLAETIDFITVEATKPLHPVSIILHRKRRLLLSLLFLLLITILISTFLSITAKPPSHPNTTQQTSLAEITPHLITTLPHINRFFTSATFSKDGKYIYAADAEGVVRWGNWKRGGEVSLEGLAGDGGNDSAVGTRRLLVTGEREQILYAYGRDGALRCRDLKDKGKDCGSIEGIGRG